MITVELAKTFDGCLLINKDNVETAVFYRSDIVSRDGAIVTLFREERHTVEDIRKAKNEARWEMDVVGFRVEKV